ncbi:MAG: hypothetical protein CL583_13305 [Alteromonadaceae bacterium]|nr:hypothetical protein [Alteromonadaceae bacterium]|tara:strand:- start:8079 stop:8396 length:318 start_codon:yes stop_codon:yes gene_type:complete
MAYNSDYLTLAVPKLGPLGTNIWVYHGIDATGTVDTAGHFTDGAARGMEPGDLVFAVVWTTAVPTTTAAKLAAAPADASLYVVIDVDGDAATVSTETALSVAATA